MLVIYCRKTILGDRLYEYSICCTCDGNAAVSGQRCYGTDCSYIYLVEAASNGGSDEYVEFRVHHRMKLQREVRGNYEEIDLRIPASDRYFLESSPLIEAYFYNF